MSTDVQTEWNRLQIEAARAALHRGPKRRIARLARQILNHPDVLVDTKRTIIQPFVDRWKLLETLSEEKCSQGP